MMRVRYRSSGMFYQVSRKPRKHSVRIESPNRKLLEILGSTAAPVPCQEPETLNRDMPVESYFQISEKLLSKELN
jgi:hypothetical protein